MNILITGGSSGLGKSITQNVASNYKNATVFFTYNSSLQEAKQIEQQYSNTRAIQLNFKEDESVENIVKFITENNIDILINNAVTSLNKNHFHKTEASIFKEGFINNIFPALKITAVFIKQARIKKQGKIISILSSAIGGMPLTGWSAYVAEKNYLLSMVKSWAAENVQFNIQSNAVSPEFLDTPLNSELDIRLKEEMIKSHPLKKLLTTEEVAEVVNFLISAPAHINGQNIFLSNAKN